METVYDALSQPWPWYVAGPLIGLMVPTLLLLLNKSFGISSSLRHACAACIPTSAEYFKYNWRRETWNLVMVAGIAIGAAIATYLFPYTGDVAISDGTRADLTAMGITNFSGLMPAEFFSWEALLSPAGIVLMVVGGFLVGFGTRYAGGCTSGHAIMGLSMLSFGSLVATIGFFIGGLIVSWFVLPALLGL